MPQARKKKALRRKHAGTAPGTLMLVGEQKTEAVDISIIDFTASQIDERKVATIEECFEYRDKQSVTWINIDGLHDLTLFEKLGEHFGVDSLVLEDCLNTRQRPKIDDYGTYVFVVMKMLYMNPERTLTEREQVSLLLGENYIISFQERPGDVFSLVRERLRAGRGRIRSRKADYLAYALIDALVDHYFAVLDEFSDRIEELDTKVIEEPTPAVLQEVYLLKREIVHVRRNIAPLREVLSSLHKGDPKLVSQATEKFFADVYDHVLQVVESIDANREILSGLIDLYLSSASNRTNDIMKVLTIMAAIFIPITFIAGVYGMNFEVIPELKWKYGYFYVWSVMLGLVLAMLLYFKKKKWM